MPIFKYFLRRFFRIAPIYYLVLLVIFRLEGNGIPGYVNPLQVSLTRPDLIAHMFFVNSFFPYFSNDFLGVEWSVSTEFLFYVLLPFVFIYVTKAPSKLVSVLRLSGLYLVSLAIYWAIFFQGGYLQKLGGGFASPVFEAWSYFFIASHLHVFILGIMVWQALSYQMSRRLNLSADLVESNAQRGYLYAFWGLVLLGIMFAYIQGFLGWRPWSAFVFLILWALLSAGLIYLFDHLRPSCDLLMRVGKISFSVYLVHFPIFMKMQGWEYWKGITPYPEINFLLFETVGLVVSITLGGLLYYWIETPGIRIGRHLISKLPA